MAKKKTPVKFTATVKLMITDAKRREVVSLKVWETIAPEDRTYVVNIHGYGRDERSKTVHYRLIKIPPFVNVVADRLRNKLKRQRVVFTEKLIVKDGEEFIHFSTIKEELW